VKKAGKPALLFVIVMMLSACVGSGSKTVVVSDFCNRVPPPPETVEIIDAIDEVPEPWQTWYGKLEADGFANCSEWSE